MSLSGERAASAIKRFVQQSPVDHVIVGTARRIRALFGQDTEVVTEIRVRVLINPLYAHIICRCHGNLDANRAVGLAVFLGPVQAITLPRT